MVTKTMRIKKKFFNAIEKGEKSIEYRADKPYYAWIGEIDLPFKLRLHYQADCFLTVTVYRVEKIKRPAQIDPILCPTPKVWALYLRD